VRPLSIQQGSIDALLWNNGRSIRITRTGAHRCVKPRAADLLYALKDLILRRIGKRNGRTHCRMRYTTSEPALEGKETLWGIGSRKLVS
jgi:hypothetical protein